MDTKEKQHQFTEIIEAHKGLIYKIAHSYVRATDDRNDLIQEIVIQLWKSFDKYDSTYRYSTWIYRIAFNVSISFCRKENRRKEIAKPLSEQLFDFGELSDTLEKETEINLLYQFISELNELDKALMVLYLDERSQHEMAEVLGISETNVATKLWRIKARLKNRFSLLKK